MLFSSRCAVQVAHFLAKGRFLHPAARGQEGELAVAA
jgi:hypothetical protein